MRLWVVATLSRNSDGLIELKLPENVPLTDGDMTTERPSATAKVSSAVRRFMSRATSVYVGSFHGIGAAGSRAVANASERAKTTEAPIFILLTPFSLKV